MAKEAVAYEAPLVDTHFHAWDMSSPISRHAFYRPAGVAPVEEALKALDAHGVVFGLVVAASLFGTYNDYMRAALKRHKRLRATAIVDPTTDIYQLEQMKADGFVGIRFVWGHLDESPDIASDEYQHLLRRVADLGWHVHFHEHEHRTAGLIEALEKGGAEKIVVDHMGRFESPEGINSPAFKALLAAIDRGKTWVKLSGGFRFKPPSAAASYAKELVRVAGGDRLLWGSDWPFAAFEEKVRYQDTLDTFAEWVPDATMRRKIGGETALRLFFT